MDQVQLSNSPLVHNSLHVKRVSHNEIMRFYLISAIENEEDFRLVLLFFIFSWQELSLENNFLTLNLVLDRLIMVFN